MKSNNILFTLFLICITITYLYFEINYNGTLIDLSTKPDITKAELESLENYGHTLTSIGLTIFFISYIYSICRRFNFSNFVSFGIVIISSLILYFSFYNSLTKLINYIVETNQDKKFSSYYATSFKYGMLNNEMGYSTFIPKERLSNLSIEDRVIISNLFLLVLQDDTLVDRVFENKNKLTEIYLTNQQNENFQNTYKEAEKKFNNKVKEINEAFDQYINKSKEVNSLLKKIESSQININRDYEDLKLKMFPENYKKYQDNLYKYKKSSNPSNEDVEEYYKNLRDYFKYKNHSKVKDKYRTNMIQAFGRFVEPSVWCRGKVCPEKSIIASVIKSEAEKSWYSKTKIPPTLNRDTFFQHPEVRKQIATEINKKFHLNLPNNFNYSRESFTKAYLDKIASEQNKVLKEFKKELKKHIGKDIDLELNYNQFVQHWKDDVIKEHGDKYGNILFKMIENNNTQNFYSDFYEPYYNENVTSKFIVTKEQLQNDKEHEEKGDYAIKSMFVIPFAIFMSLFTSILNIFKIITLTFRLVIDNIKLKEQIKNTIKKYFFVFYIIILSFVILYPYYFGKSNNVLTDYKILHKENESKYVNYYIEAMNWILPVEKFSYEKLYKELLCK